MALLSMRDFHAFAARSTRNPFRGSRFGVRGSMFRVHHKPPEYNSPPASPSGWSGGTLDIPWTCPGTIEPSQTPVFDQPSLSIPLFCGISAAEGFRCVADLWSAGSRSLRLCGPCSPNLEFWALHSALCLLPWGRDGGPVSDATQFQRRLHAGSGSGGPAARGRATPP